MKIQVSSGHLKDTFIGKKLKVISVNDTSIVCELDDGKPILFFEKECKIVKDLSQEDVNEENRSNERTCDECGSIEESCVIVGSAEEKELYICDNCLRDILEIMSKKYGEQSKFWEV